MKLRDLISRFLGIKLMYTSETSKVRHLVTKWCVGKGCDIGFGGDKVMKANCDGIDYATPYAYTGKDKVDIACNVGNEPLPVADNTYDYVYSSHLIEDFEDTALVLRDFVRVLKSGGNLILVFPDQQVYEKHCLKTGQPLNIHHVHEDMGYNFMIQVMNQLENIKFEILFNSNCEILYNVIIVAKIYKSV